MGLKGTGAGGRSQVLKEGRGEQHTARADLSSALLALSGSRCDPEEQGHLRDDRLGMDGISGEP